MKKVALLSLIIMFYCAFTTSLEAKNTLDSAAKTIKKETEFGKKAALELEKHIPRLLDPNKEAHLSLITSRLIPFLERFNYISYFRNKEQCFFIAGGTTYITTGSIIFKERCRNSCNFSTRVCGMRKAH